MASPYQLEESSDRYLLEDGSGVYLMEEDDVTVALTGQSAYGAVGTIRVDWHIESAVGAIGPETAVLLSGVALAASHGTVTAEGESSPDRDAALSGLEATAESGAIGVTASFAPDGLDSATATGNVQPNTDVAGDGLACSAESGTVTVLGDITEALSGQAMVMSAGVLSPEGGDVGDELVFLQRQRRFGKSTTPLVRQPYPRKVR